MDLASTGKQPSPVDQLRPQHQALSEPQALVDQAQAARAREGAAEWPPPTTPSHSLPCPSSARPAPSVATTGSLRSATTDGASTTAAARSGSTSSSGCGSWTRGSGSGLSLGRSFVCPGSSRWLPSSGHRRGRRPPLSRGATRRAGLSERAALRGRVGAGLQWLHQAAQQPEDIRPMVAVKQGSAEVMDSFKFDTTRRNLWKC
jgi:hypothetical protein